MLLAQGFRFVLQFVALSVLSRLLTPEQFGLAAMVTALVAVGEVLRDFGLSTATLQAVSITREQQSFLFAVNVAIGGVLAATVFFGAGAIAGFYDDPAVESVAAWMSLYFVFSGVGAQYRASLLRDHRFGAVAIAEILGYGLGVIGAIVLAVSGHGVGALVFQQLAFAACAMLIYVAFGRWVPVAPWRGARSAVELVKIGRNVFLTQVVAHFTRNVDSIIAGRQFGAAGLGFYNRGFQLIMLPVSQINGPATSVSVPILSKIRDDVEAYNRAILKAQDALLVGMVVVIGVVVLWAEVIVRVLLGSGWGDAVPIVRVLAVAAVFQGASYVAYWVFVSRGLTGSHLRFTLVTRPIVIVLLIVGAQAGPVGLAVAYSLGAAVIWPLSLVWLGRVCEFQAAAVFWSAAAVLAPSACAVILGLFASNALGMDSWAGALVGSLLCCLAVGMWLAVARPFRRAVQRAYEFGIDAVRLRRG